MFIVTQDKQFSVKASTISRFFIDEDHSLYAYCGEDGELLLGKYQTSDGALDAMVAILEALETGKTYQVPADN